MSFSDKQFAFEMFKWALEAARNVCADHWEARSRIGDLEQNCYYEYAEPGYTTPETGIILLGNWNPVTRFDHLNGKNILIDDTMVQLGRIFEALDIEMEWSDEWTNCHACGKLVRTHADWWGWTPSYFEGDGHLTCIECIREDPEAYLSELEESGRGNSISQIDPSEHGYVLIQDEFESGFHPGQTDSADKILSVLKESGCERVIMNLDSVGQFDSKFSAWMHEDEAEENLAMAKRVLREERISE